jgi:hypothetical protein
MGRDEPPQSPQAPAPAQSSGACASAHHRLPSCGNPWVKRSWLCNAVVLGLLVVALPGLSDGANAILGSLGLCAALLAMGCGTAGLARARRAVPSGLLGSLAGTVGAMLLLLLCLIPLHNWAVELGVERIRRNMCADNLRRIAEACGKYAGVHGGEYPDRLSRLYALGYVNHLTARCPSTAGIVKEDEFLLALDYPSHANGSYMYLGARMCRANTRPTTILLFEPIGNHRSGGHVLFASGEVQWWSATDITQLARDRANGQ